MIVSGKVDMTEGFSDIIVHKLLITDQIGLKRHQNFDKDRL